jgi:hypothetical protein
MVVPVFPPTGAAGAGSLNPSLGPSPLTIVIVADCKDIAADTQSTSTIARKDQLDD